MANMEQLDADWEYDPQVYLRRPLGEKEDLSTLRSYAARASRETGLWMLRVKEDVGLDRYYDGNFVVLTSRGEHGPFSYDNCRAFIAGIRIGVDAAAEEKRTTGDYSAR